MEITPSFPTFESAENKLKKDINDQLVSLLQKGTRLADIVEILDAKEFLEQIENKKGQPPVDHFNVDKFIEKRSREKRRVALPEEYIKLDETILPSSEMEMRIGTGNGFKEAGIIPRSTMLMEILAELGLKYSVIEGKNDPRMVRKLSYLIFDLPSARKIVLVNNEEGNATFVVHKVQAGEWQDYAKKTKEELYELPYFLVSSIRYPDKSREGHENRWKNEIKELLIKGPKHSKLSTDSELISTPPEGWKLTKYLAAECQTDESTLKKHFEKYRKNHPDWFKIFKHPVQGTRFEYLSPQLCETMIEKFHNLAPTGWITLRALAIEVGITPKTVQNFMEKYRVTNPDWFKKYRHEKKLDQECLHPDLAEKIRSHYEKIKEKKPKEGWMTVRGLAESGRISISDTTLRPIVEKYKAEHPEWFKIFRNEMGNERMYLSPKLIGELIDKYEIPEGWVLPADLSKSFGVSYHAIYNHIEKYRTTHPEWFKTYKDSRENEHEYFSPELIKILADEYKELRDIPEGWISRPAILKETGMTEGGIYGFYKKYEKEHPDWIKMYLTPSGSRTIYFHPDLAQKIRGRFSGHVSSKLFEKAPNGWETNSSLIESPERHSAAIKKVAYNYKMEHPDWFKIYKDRKGNPREHYSPELVDIIKRELPKSPVKFEKAPSDWLTIVPAAKSAETYSKAFKTIADKYKADHPEWFKVYLKQGSPREHYSPELVEVIKKELKKG
jgi:hypothetical protein